MNCYMPKIEWHFSETLPLQDTEQKILLFDGSVNICITAISNKNFKDFKKYYKPAKINNKYFYGIIDNNEDYYYFDWVAIHKDAIKWALYNIPDNISMKIIRQLTQYILEESEED